MATYTKSMMINDLAKSTGLSRDNVAGILDGFTGLVNEKAAEGFSVALPELGRFVRKTRAARNGRNPATGEAMQIPEKQVLTFKPAKPKS